MEKRDYLFEVLCTNNSGVTNSLTKGRKYYVLKEVGPYYELVNDLGTMQSYFTARFSRIHHKRVQRKDTSWPQ